tara:strand:+ start:1157 stop:1957 length:801 start_codon:yes stop_codon:yes gene_type:complete
MKTQNDPLNLGGELFDSRLFIGTGKFSSGEKMVEAVRESCTEMVTIAMKRADPIGLSDSIFEFLSNEKVRLLPNTSGVRDAKEAIFAAQMAREAFGTNWLKLEIHPDPKYLMPDPIETLRATEELCKDGFIVLPYCHADPVLCKKLEDVGSAAVMPLGSPIGTNQGLKSKEFLRIIIEQAGVPVVIDAGIGRPSQAAEAMELGSDAVLINTAIAIATDPVQMAQAFGMAVNAGRAAFLSGLGQNSDHAQPTSPLTGFLNSIENNED